MAVAVLFTASCAKEDISSSIGGEVEVTFTANLPELGTRAYGEGSEITTLRYEVYSNGETLSDLCGTTSITAAAPITVNLVLLKGMSYDILFWADNGSDLYTINNGVVSFSADGILANDESRDAFYAAVKGFNPADANADTTIELYRPFAQLNAKVTNMTEVNKSITVTSTTISTKIYTTFSPFAANENDVVGGLTANPVEFTATPMTAADLAAGHLSMNYLLAPADGCVADVAFTFNNDKNVAITGTTYTNVPLKANYRTNIIGALLTNSTDFEVKIEAGFAGEKPETLEEKLSLAAQLGGEFTLTEDVVLAEDKSIEVKADFVLNLNGKTITGNIAKSEGPVIKVAEGATLAISNGTVSSTAINGGSAIVNNGTTTIENVTINGAPIVDGGWPSYGINNNGTLTINGATITTYHGAVATGGEGVTVINDATIDVGNSTETNQTSWALYVYENGQLTVNGGSFANTKNEYGQVYGGGYICTSSTKETIINGGSFDKTEGDNNGTGFYYNCQNLVIKGGTFDANPSAYVATGYTAVDNGNGTWTVVKELNSSTISTAFENLSTTEPTTIAVTENIDIDAPLAIPAGVEVTVELGDNEITSTTTDAFVVNEGATLTINGNGTVKSNGAPIRAIGGKVIVEGGEFTQTGAWNTATSTYRYSIDSREGGEVIIKGGIFNTNNGLISVSSDSSVVINGGEFTFENNTGGTRHFAYVSGALSINDGVFRGVADSGAGGCFFCGAASTCNIQVNGGKFTSLWASGSVNKIFESYASGSSIDVTGGLFNTNGGIASFVEANTDTATMADYPYKAK